MKYFLGVFAVIIVLIFSVVIITSRANDNAQNKVEVAQTAEYRLQDNVDKPATRLVLETRGEINGENEHEAIRVTVSRTERKYEVLKGYQKTVKRTEKFANNEKAYQSFLLALDKLGFGNTQKADYEDNRGACPFGKLYTYQFIEGQDKHIDSWSSTCSEDGTFAGKESTVNRLFQNQIPDYRKLARDVNL